MKIIYKGIEIHVESPSEGAVLLEQITNNAATPVRKVKSIAKPKITRRRKSYSRWERQEIEDMLIHFDKGINVIRQYMPRHTYNGVASALAALRTGNYVSAGLKKHLKAIVNDGNIIIPEGVSRKALS